MGTDEWGNPSPNTPGGLKGRFGWVYEYITKGKMPVEVLRFMDALRQAWSEDGTVLRITTHPYTPKADCAIGSFLNPDLCPRWVNWIMTKNDAKAKVLKWLPERYGVHVTAEKIKLTKRVYSRTATPWILSATGSLGITELRHSTNIPSLSKPFL